MKRFTEYLNEDFDPAIYNSDGAISIKDPTVLDAINSNLEVSTSCVFRTPYNALEEVRKVLAYYKIFLPKGVFLDQNHGNDVFEVSQFGEKMGMNNNGEVVTASDSPLFVYFEWSLSEKGMYDVFAALVDQTELDEILADYDAEVESDETDLQENHSIAKISKMLYRAANQAKSMKQKADVEAYVEHEKQGKTFTQTNEEAMPDLKKKMGAKKVTLPNMMRKEETINEVSKEKLKKYVKGAKADRDLAISDREHYKSNLKDPDKAWTKSIPHKDSQYKMAVDRNARAMKRSKGIEKAEKKLASEEAINEISGKLARKAEHKAADKYHAAYDAETDARKKYIKSKSPEDKSKSDEAREKRLKAAKRTIKFQQYADKKLKEEKDDVPFDNPTEKPSTPYKNPKAKAKQLARMAMKKAKTENK